MFVGRAKLWADGELLIDNWTTQRNGDFLYGCVAFVDLIPDHSHQQRHLALERRRREVLSK